MLKRLFTSATRVKILTIFLLNPEKEFYIRELTRELDEQINSIRRELDNLKVLGLLKTKEKNRKKYYYINKDFSIYPELRSIISKGVSNQKELTKKITTFGQIDVLIMSGLFVNQESLIDLLIVGEIDKEKLEAYFNYDMETSRPIKFSLMSREDYLYRLQCNDKFLNELLKDENNIIAINRI